MKRRLKTWWYRLRGYAVLHKGDGSWCAIKGNTPARHDWALDELRRDGWQ